MASMADRINGMTPVVERATEDLDRLQTENRQLRAMQQQQLVRQPQQQMMIQPSEFMQMLALTQKAMEMSLPDLDSVVPEVFDGLKAENIGYMIYEDEITITIEDE